jgi:hypothetical protein
MLRGKFELCAFASNAIYSKLSITERAQLAMYMTS